MSMKEAMEARLSALEAEHESGLKMEAELQQKVYDLQQTLLRIAGAIEVMKEMLTE